MGKLGYILAGAAAGAVTGLFGSGGGLVLIPLLSRLTDIEEADLFPSSVCIVAVLCVVCLAFASVPLPLKAAWPYLLGGGLGGGLAGALGQRIPVLWLHRALGILILWGGWRYLWN